MRPMHADVAPTQGRTDLADPAARLAYAQALDCVHCGLCTQSCPTYLVTGIESQNPRGRIYLMRALLEGRTEPTPDLVEDLDSCLVCRACEAICPSGVRFGELMAHTRSEMRKPGRLRRFLLRKVVPDPRRLGRLAKLLRFVQSTKLDLLRFILPGRLRRLAAAAPRIPDAEMRRTLPRRAAAIGERRGSVAFFTGCVMPILFQDVNRDTIRLLQHAGFDVDVPTGQTCCGALHEHDGDLEHARTLAAVNAAAFGPPAAASAAGTPIAIAASAHAEDAADETIAAPASFVVMNSAGCGAAVKGYGHLLADGKDAPAGEHLARRSVDWSRFLVDHGGPLVFAAPETDDGRPLVVTYDAPCHLLHAQGEATAPLALLGRIPGVEFRPMHMADICCGAAGIYNLDHPEMSAAVLAPKLDALEKTGASVLLTGNPGCLLQWRAGVAERGLAVRVEHPATFLASLLA